MEQQKVDLTQRCLKINHFRPRTASPRLHLVLNLNTLVAQNVVVVHLAARTVPAAAIEPARDPLAEVYVESVLIQHTSYEVRAEVDPLLFGTQLVGSCEATSRAVKVGYAFG